MSTNKTPHTGGGFFLYSRKSTEAEDRQILSIDSQIDEVKALAERLGLTIIEVFREARSAKAPGRPLFTKMMQRLQAGEATGILCWKLDRLARNPMDGGALIWAVNQNGIRILTPTQSYSQADDNMILMYIEFGMAHKYISDLSRVVKRGLEAKARGGWYPAGAPLGYLNDPRHPKGQKTVVMDPERFPLVRKMWDLILSGTYSPRRILTVARDDWGFLTRAGTPLSRSGLYYLFSNPFYTGSFEYPLRSGHWFKGNHEPMITESEYDRVQTLLGSKGRPRAVSRTFAYTGLIRCGGCEAMITAEEKHQLICAVCRHKFAHRGKDHCPRCRTRIHDMLDRGTTRKPTVLHYVYYHCTKRKDPTCPERAIRVEDLEGHFADYLERMETSEQFQRWVVERLRRSQEKEMGARNALKRSHDKTYKACLARLDNLIRLKTAPENHHGSLLSDAEYARQRSILLKEQGRLEEILRDNGHRITQWLGLVEEVFDFTRHARARLQHRDPETKRLLLAVFSMEGSNLTLAAKKLRIDASKPFPILGESLPSIPRAKPMFEPEESRMNKRQENAFASSCPGNLGQLDDVRTENLMKSSQDGSYGARHYGQSGVRLVQRLRDWLQSTPNQELVALRGRMMAVREKVQSGLRSA
jgi:site-specific DNA recombinase